MNQPSSPASHGGDLLAGLLARLAAARPDADTELITRAYEAAAYWHEGEQRRSGDPYITHPVAVAEILADAGAGADWWPDEEITAAQVTAISAAGHADVLVSHDCPAGVQHDFGRLPASWAAADLARSDAHRQRLQHLVDAVRPRHVMYGHLHRAYQRDCDFGYGPVQVIGLAADGRLRNFTVLDVAAMRWERRDGLQRRARGRPGRHRG